MDDQHFDAGALGAGGLVRDVPESGGQQPKSPVGIDKHGPGQARDNDKPQENPTPIAGEAERNPNTEHRERTGVGDREHRPPKNALLEYGPSVAMVVFTAGIFVATVVYAWISNGQLAAIQKQADIAAADLRPWIKIDRVRPPPPAPRYFNNLAFHGPPNGQPIPPQIRYVISMQNVGHSVAENVSVRGDFYFVHFTSSGFWDDVTRYQKQFCAPQIVPIYDVGGHRLDRIPGQLLFPSEKLTITTGAVGTTDQKDLGATGVATALIVCVDYTDAAGASHQTQMAAGVLINGGRIIKMGQDSNALQFDRVSINDHAI